MKRGKMALVALFLAFLGMFLVTSQNIKAGADDSLSLNTEITIYGSDGTNYMISGKSGTYSNSYTVVGPMELSIIADGGQFCGYFSSCVTLRGNYSYSGIGAGSYSIYVVDYYNSTSTSIDTYATYSISITVTASSSSSGSSSGSSSSSGATASGSGPVWYTDNISKIYGGTSIYVQLTSTNEIWSYSSASTYYSYKWLSSSGTTLSSGSTFTSQTSTKIAFTTTAPYVVEDSECYLQIYYRGKDTSGNLSTFEGKGVSYSSTYNSSFKYTYTIIGDSEAPIWYTKDVDEIESDDTLSFQLIDSYSGLVGTFYYGWTTSSTYFSSYTLSSIIDSTINAPIVTSTTIFYLWIKNTGKDKAGNLATYEGKEPYSIGTNYETPIIYKYTVKPSDKDVNPIWYTENIDEIDSGDTISFQLTTDLYSATLSGNTSVSSYYKYGWSTSSTTEPSSWKTNFTSSTSTQIAFSTSAPGVISTTPYYLWIYKRGDDNLGNISIFEGKQPLCYGTTSDSRIVYQYTINSKGPVWFVEDKDTISYGETIKVELIGENISDYSSYSSFKYGWSTSSTTEPSWEDNFFLRLPSIVSFYPTCSLSTSYVYLWIRYRGQDDAGNLSTFSGKEPKKVGNYSSSTIIYSYKNTGSKISKPILFTENVDSVTSTENIRFHLFASDSSGLSYSTNKYGWSTSATTEPSTWETDFIQFKASSYPYYPTAIFFDVAAPYVSTNTTYYLWLYYRGKDSNGVADFEGKQPYSSSSSATSKVVYQYTILGTNDNEAPVWSVENKNELFSDDTISLQLTDNKTIWKSLYATTYYKYGWSTSSTTEPSSWNYSFISKTSTKIAFEISAPVVTSNTTYYLWIKYRGKDTAGNISTFEGKQPYSSDSTYDSNVIYQYTIIFDGEAPVWYTEDTTEVRTLETLYFQLTDNKSIYKYTAAGTYYKYGWSTSSTTEPSSWETSFTSETVTKIAFEISAPVVTSNTIYYLWIYYRGEDISYNISAFEGKQPYLTDDSFSSNVIYEYTIIPENEAPVWYTENLSEISTNSTLYFQLTHEIGIQYYSSASNYYKYGWSTSSTTAPLLWETYFTTKTLTKISFATSAPLVANDTTYYLWIYSRGQNISANTKSTFNGKQPYSSGAYWSSPVIYQYTILADTTSPTIRLNSSSGEILEDKNISYYSNVPLTLFFEDNLYFKKYVVSGPVTYTGTGDRYTISSAGSYSISAYDYAGNMTSIFIEISDDGTIPSKAILEKAELERGKITFTISSSNNIQEEYKDGIAIYFIGKYGNYTTDTLLKDGFEKYGVTYDPKKDMPASKFFEKGTIITPQGLIGNVELYIMLKLDDKDTSPLILKSGSINITNAGSANIVFTSSEADVVNNEIKPTALTVSNIVVKESTIKGNYLLFVSMILISSLLAIEVIIIRKHKKAHN